MEMLVHVVSIGVFVGPGYATMNNAYNRIVMCCDCTQPIPFWPMPCVIDFFTAFIHPCQITVDTTFIRLPPPLRHRR